MSAAVIWDLHGFSSTVLRLDIASCVSCRACHFSLPLVLQEKHAISLSLAVNGQPTLYFNQLRLQTHSLSQPRVEYAVSCLLTRV